MQSPNTVIEQLAQDRGLWQQIVRRVGEPSLAEDVLQQVLIIVYQKLPQLRDFSRLRPWVFQIMKNEAIKIAMQNSPSASEEHLKTQKIHFSTPGEAREIILKTLEIPKFFTKTEFPVAQILIEETLAGVDYKIILQAIQKQFEYDINYTTTLIYRIRRKLDKYLQQKGYQSYLKRTLCS